VKIVLLSLRSIGGKVILNYNLTALLTSYFDHHSLTLEIRLPTGTIYLNKWAYLNRYKIYSDGNVSFMAFSYKKPDVKLVLKMLLEYEAKIKTPTIKQRAKHRKVA